VGKGKKGGREGWKERKKGARGERRGGEEREQKGDTRHTNLSLLLAPLQTHYGSYQIRVFTVQ